MHRNERQRGCGLTLTRKILVCRFNNIQFVMEPAALMRARTASAELESKWLLRCSRTIDNASVKPVQNCGKSSCCLRRSGTWPAATTQLVLHFPLKNVMPLCPLDSIMSLQTRNKLVREDNDIVSWRIVTSY